MRIDTIDLEFQGASNVIASFLIHGPGGPVLVETGPVSTLPTLLARLEERGVRPGDVRDVLVTHIHLDHAGAAGWWAREGARVWVHSVGAPHLVDPGKLLASAKRIYGDRMDALWGEVVAAPADRVIAVDDGAQLEVGGLSITAIDTPGHAWHHHVYRLEDVAFTGDAAGILLPGHIVGSICRRHPRSSICPPGSGRSIDCAASSCARSTGRTSVRRRTSTTSSRGSRRCWIRASTGSVA